MSLFALAKSRAPRGSRINIFAGAACAAVLLSASSAAFAQCVGTVTGLGAPRFGAQFAAASAASGSASAGYSAGIGNLSTGFLTQQGSAFVSAPGNPQPDQPGGGVWVRGIGGEVTNKFTSRSSGALVSADPTLATQSNFNCAGSVRSTFAGAQVGQDIARLNWGGWNVHLGTTAGYMSSRTTDNGGNITDFNVPFVGGYAVATRGRFFADVMVRNEFYNSKLTNVSVGLFGQEVGGRGTSVSTSAGYNFALANDWFIEPSAGFIWSRTNVDSFVVSGGAITQGATSLYQTAPIESQIGRLSLRGGKTFTSGNMLLQPFASVSVFHEFAGNVTSTATSLNAVALPATPILITSANSTSRVGTYGQYSLGLAGQIINTGWLGFVRADYRNGSNIDGWTGNAGLRYQFTPEFIAAAMPTKVKAPSGFIAPTNWTGFYVGGFLGAAYGNTDIRFVGTNNVGNDPRVMGALGGGQIGYNYHAANNWVFGVEGDIGAANLRGSRTCTTAPGIDFGTGLTCQNRSDWIATAAARIGYSWGRTLLYVKGGGAWADDKVTTSCVLGPLNGVFVSCLNQFGALTNGFSNSGHRSGWLIGYGTEFDLGKNWSAKAEWNHIGFGSRTALASDGVTLIRDGGDISQVKIGVNYRFSGATALVAKY